MKRNKKVLFKPFTPDHRRENKERLLEFFYKRLDKTVYDNQHRKKPYFITYKLKFDQFEPWKAKDIMTVHETLPDVLVAGTVVHLVDNEKGICSLLRVVEP